LFVTSAGGLGIVSVAEFYPSKEANKAPDYGLKSWADKFEYFGVVYVVKPKARH
jgi:hypothetical protein